MGTACEVRAANREWVQWRKLEAKQVAEGLVRAMSV